MLKRGYSVGDVSRIQFDADVAPAESLRDEADRARAKKRVEDEIISFGRCENAGFDQRLRKRCNVGAARIGSIDLPNRAAIARPAIVGGLLHCFVIVAVVLRLGEHEEVFVRTGRPIFDALRHDVWLVPHNVAAEEPSVVLQRQREPPRDAQQVFVFESGGIVRTHVHRPVGILFVGSPPSAVSAGVAIADIEPEDTVLLENALHFGKHIGQRLDESGQRRLQSDLSCDAVVTQSPIGRRGDDALHGFVRQSPKREMDVAFKHR